MVTLVAAGAPLDTSQGHRCRASHSLPPRGTQTRLASQGPGSTHDVNLGTLTLARLTISLRYPSFTSSHLTHLTSHARRINYI
ncbi:hypothetical protein E2C01_053890 [Portunus trituberculatus]|uniref:Uncharacterized protein n=1 Tax=Portunus trituberculatus TaxID=210409 RepID=A0A5B7GLJ6_PORTR|nr:hypothetical protein [Portunus trituberculatus]